MKDRALTRALESRGMAASVARKLGISTGAVAQWERCPAEHARTLEALTGVPRYELRPDLWDDPASGKAPADDARPDSASVERAVREAQELLARYVDTSRSLSEELIQECRAAAARGE